MQNLLNLQNFLFRKSSAISAVFSPSDISGIRLWLKSESLDAISNDATIATWTDSSGGGFDASQSTESSKPIKQTVSGKSVCRFVSTDRLFSTTMTAIGTSEFHTFIVLKRNGGSGDRTIFSLGNGAGANGLHNVDPGNNYYFNPAGSGGFADGASVDATTEIMEVRKSSGTVYVKKYGGSESSSALTVNTDAGFVLGSYNEAGAQPFAGDVFEVIVYPSNLSAGNLSSVESYLATKYGL